VPVPAPVIADHERRDAWLAPVARDVGEPVRAAVESVRGDHPAGATVKEARLVHLGVVRVSVDQNVRGGRGAVAERLPLPPFGSLARAPLVPMHDTDYAPLANLKRDRLLPRVRDEERD